jgi:type I restriction enzyme S subunit
MNKYQSYKPSGVEWIGEIPEKWRISKFKYVSKLYTGNSLNDEQKLLYESDDENHFPYVSSKDIDLNTRNVNYNNGLRIPKENNPLKVSPKDSFLLCVEGGSSGRKMVYLDREVCFVNKLCSFKSVENTRFQYYFIQSSNFQDKFRLSLSGLIGGVSISTLRDFELVLPSIQEQHQIVQFLDEKTVLIDKLISTKERKITLLKEQRTSLINQVVTKGLNPNVKMKDSGVEWIGEIPEHWKISKLGFYTTKIGSGSTPKGGSEIYPDSGIPFIRSQNVHFNGLRLSDVSFIDFDTHKSMKGSKVIKNDVLLNITGGSIGRCCIVEVEGEMNVNQHVSIIRTTLELVNYFLNYILSSDLGQSQVLFNLTGGNREGLTIDGIRNFRITIPPMKEQLQMVQHLNFKTKEIDDLIQLEQKKIDLLKEYRQSLISEVVTGKIKVTN